MDLCAHTPLEATVTNSRVYEPATSDLSVKFVEKLVTEDNSAFIDSKDESILIKMDNTRKHFL